MARPRAPEIDLQKLLLGIAEAIDADTAALQETIATAEAAFYAGPRGSGWFDRWMDVCDLKDELERLQQLGIGYDLPRFADDWLSPSERVRYQRAVRQLEFEGLVEIKGAKACRVKLTAAGRAKLAPPDACGGEPLQNTP